LSDRIYLVDGDGESNTPARAMAFVALASFAIGASQTLAILIVGLGAHDKHIGVAIG